jgi:hypothetical protein
MVDNSELAEIKQMLNDAVDFLGSSPSSQPALPGRVPYGGY